MMRQVVERIGIGFMALVPWFAAAGAATFALLMWPQVTLLVVAVVILGGGLYMVGSMEQESRRMDAADMRRAQEAARRWSS